MNRIDLLLAKYESDLKEISDKNFIDFESLVRLLSEEKTKKLLKRRVSIQDSIDREFNNI